MDLYQELSSPQIQQVPSNDFFSGLYEFAKIFKGNPQSQVEQLMKSGKISQQQYNNAVNKTNMIYGMLNKR